MYSYSHEFLGSAILLLLGIGVVANVLLRESKGREGGWIVITFGWAMAVFCTSTAIRSYGYNFITEAIGSFVLILCVLFIVGPDTKLGALEALPVALVVLAIGLSLGGPTGYAINPARDLGPRIVHAMLPIPGKAKSDWAYAWVPILGPIAGALLAVALFKCL